MDWREKISVIRALVAKRPELCIVFDAPGEGASDEFMSKLRGAFPFVASEYEGFLRQFDGMQLDMFLLYGSGKSGYPDVFSRIPALEVFIDFNGLLPIGESPSGDAFVLDGEGRVHLVSVEPPFESEPIAGSFGELLEEFLIGPRFLSFFPNGRKDSEWIELLADQGWINVEE